MLAIGNQYRTEVFNYNVILKKGAIGSFLFLLSLVNAVIRN